MAKREPITTERGFLRLKAEPKFYAVSDGDTPGLFLQVMTSGVKSWAFYYRAPTSKKLVKMTLGKFPGELTLDQARRKAWDVRIAVADLRDPVKERKVRKSEVADHSDMVDALLDSYLTRVDTNNRPRTTQEIRRAIDRRIRPAWTGRKIGSITGSDLEMLVASVAKTGGPVAANRTFSIARTFLNFCVRRRNRDGRGVIQVSPAAGFTRKDDLFPEKPRSRVLSDEELRVLWLATGQGGPLAAMVRLLVLTGQRRGEVANMRRDELKLDRAASTWIIPRERVKNKHEHEVPLVPTVVR
jgi:integrase